MKVNLINSFYLPCGKMYEKENAIIFKNLWFIGGTLFFSGIVLLFLSTIIIHYYEWYLTKILYGSIIMIPLGLCMMFCPGGDLTPAEVASRHEGDTKRLPYFRVVWQKAPVLHKIVWILSLFVGIIMIAYMDKRLFPLLR